MPPPTPNRATGYKNKANMGMLDLKAHSEWVGLVPFPALLKRQASGTNQKMKGWKGMELKDLFLEAKEKSWEPVPLRTEVTPSIIINSQ